MKFQPVLLSTLLALTSATTAFAGGTFTWPSPPIPADANPAATAVFPLAHYLNLFELDLQRSRQMASVDLIFDGDTLAISNGQYGPIGGMWQRYNRINAYDFARPSDATQNVLWRLQQGQVDGLHPKLIVLEVGGGNLSTNTPEETAEGVKAVVTEYQKRCPGATIVLLSVFPRGEKPTYPTRVKVDAINKIISRLGDGKKVIYVDLGPKLLQPDGTMTKQYLGDFTFVHPTGDGYKVWGDAIQPVVDQIFPPATLPPPPKPAPAPVVAAGTTPPAPDEPSPSDPVIGGGTFTWPPPPLPPGANSAVVPLPPMGWMVNLQKHIDAAKKLPQVDLIFDGDSITAGWMGGGGGIWHKHYGKLNAIDFAISGDTTQGVLWLAQNGELDGLHPKLVVLLIGTNNMGRNSPEQIAGGVKAIIDEYQKHCPEAVILVQGIFPRAELPTDPVRAKVKATNLLISKFADGKKVLYIDFGDKLLTPDGRYTQPMTGDFIHPGLPGYQIWADSIQPIIDQYFPPDNTSPRTTPPPSPVNP